MTAHIQPAEWLRFLDSEYLGGFVRDGGASVKFAVPLDDALRPALFEGLADVAQRAGYTVVRINSAETRVHMADEIFFRTAEQIPWQTLSRRFVVKLAAGLGYSAANLSDGPLYSQLAEANSVDPQMLLLDLKKALGGSVFKERRLSRDFRLAMTHLCMAELTGGPEGSTTIKILTDWLSGRNRALSAVKPYHIFRRITRTTARFFFESMVYWVRLNAYPGMVILLDAERVMMPRNHEDSGFFYSKAAVLDTYELLRQFIDGAANLTGFLLIVVPDIGFLEDHTRGLGAYEALKYRVFDEVRDRALVNPMASLARIADISPGE